MIVRKLQPIPTLAYVVSTYKTSFLLLAWLAVCYLPASAATQPNIVFILLDDVGAEAIGAYGGTSFATPNIDRLADKGMRFDNCHSQPVCSPSRAELITGISANKLGIYHALFPRAKFQLDPGAQPTLPQHMARAGYATGIFGKWHLCVDLGVTPRHVAETGFQEEFLWDTYRGEYITRHYWNPALFQEGKRCDELGVDRFGDDLYVDRAIEFMRRHRSGPFFLYLPLSLVHSETAIGRNWPRSPDTLHAGDDPSERVVPDKQGFGDLLQYADKLVGRVVDAVEGLGLGPNTIIVLCGDNGTDVKIKQMVCQGDLVDGGKATNKETGSRVPLIVSWPGRVAVGAQSLALVSFTDFFPTLAEAAHRPLSGDTLAKIDGVSFFPVLNGAAQAGERQWLYVQFLENWAVRTRDYRLLSDGTLLDMRDGCYHPRTVDPQSEIYRELTPLLQSYVANMQRRNPPTQVYRDIKASIRDWYGWFQANRQARLQNVP